MKAVICARNWTRELQECFGDKEGEVDLPDDTDSFLKVLSRFGRFEFNLSESDIEPDVWVIEFHNDYD